MQMPRILWLVWSGELRGAGEAQVLRLCVPLGGHMGPYPEDGAKPGRVLSGQGHDHTLPF